MARVASIGECMVELAQEKDGRFVLGFGGDTLNTAIYLARLGQSVDYATALGNDPFSHSMKAAWAAEGVGLGLVLEVPGRLPGLYLIETNEAGERKFSHWRDSAPARQLFELPGSPELSARLASYDLIYFSGITLQILGERGRSHLWAALDAAQKRGTQIAFDTNFRARGWPDLNLARQAFAQALDRADIIFASDEDMRSLRSNGGEGWRQDGLSHRPKVEIVLKHDAPAVTVQADGTRTTIAANPVASVVDTTAAGDSFAAAYLAARLEGKPAVVAAKTGHALAGVVVQHRGAIIPRAAMPAPATY